MLATGLPPQAATFHVAMPPPLLFTPRNLAAFISSGSASRGGSIMYQRRLMGVRHKRDILATRPVRTTLFP